MMQPPIPFWKFPVSTTTIEFELERAGYPSLAGLLKQGSIAKFMSLWEETFPDFVLDVTKPAIAVGKILTFAQGLPTHVGVSSEYLQTVQSVLPHLVKAFRAELKAADPELEALFVTAPKAFMLVWNKLYPACQIDETDKLGSTLPKMTAFLVSQKSMESADVYSESKPDVAAAPVFVGIDFANEGPIQGVLYASGGVLSKESTPKGVLVGSLPPALTTHIVSAPPSEGPVGDPSFMIVDESALSKGFEHTELPGFVYYKEALTASGACLLLAQFEHVIQKQGLYQPAQPGTSIMSPVLQTNFGSWGWFSDGSGSGYIKCHPITGKPWDAIPQCLVDLVEDLLEVHAVPYSFEPNSCLVTWYSYHDNSKLPPRVDDLAESTNPVVQVHLGLTARMAFDLKVGYHSFKGILRHGDVVVLSGPSCLRGRGIANLYWSGVPSELFLHSWPSDYMGCLAFTLRQIK